jgi:hypothetical protein
MSTAGAAGVVMLYLCATGSLTGWGWPVISGFLILTGISQDERKIKSIVLISELAEKLTDRRGETK